MSKEDVRPPAGVPAQGEVSTLEAARLLGLAVRSVQLMVDRGELQAWKTPGGHRRISLESIQRWRNGERVSAPAPLPAHSAPAPLNPTGGSTREAAAAPRVLLIEDSIHFQNLVALVLSQQFPQVDLRIANDAIAGLAMAGEVRPDVLIVDILLPGIDGATLITSLRTNALFQDLQLIVITSLDANQREPYAFALQGLPVIHKPALVTELPARLAACLAARRTAAV